MYEDDLEMGDGDDVFRRSYSNLISHPESELGASWMISAQPRIVQKDNAHLIRSGASQQVAFLNQPDGTFNHIRNGRERLKSNAGGDLVFVDPMGATAVFYGFDAGVPERQRGRLKRTYTAGGTPTVMAYDANGFTSSRTRHTTDSSVQDLLQFTYDPTSGMLTEAKRLRLEDGKEPQVVLKAAYGFDPETNQLRSVAISNGANEIVRRFHYRYYVTQGDGAYVGMLHMAIGPRNYERAVAAGKDPDLAGTLDADLLPFADKVFTYDSARRVSGQVLRTPDVDGSGTYGYVYDANPNAGADPGPNVWLTRFTEIQPDASVNLVYTNRNGDVLYKQTTNAVGALVAADAYSYNDAWRMTHHFTGAALEQDGGVYYKESLPDLIGFNPKPQGMADSPHVRNAAGLIEVIEYNAAADGNIASKSVQIGESGTKQLQKSYTYVSHSAP